MKKLIPIFLLLSVACNNDNTRVCSWLFDRDCSKNRLNPYHEPLAKKNAAIISVKSYSHSHSNQIYNTHKNVFNAAKKQQRKFGRYIKNKKYIAIINYNLPYTSERFWLFDTTKNKIVFRTSVSHASRTGNRYANKFSNTPNSYMSSKGSFVTLNTFDGTYGYSLRLKGLENGTNNNARKRGIIFHPSNGMSHSAGCFMLPDSIAEETFDKIKNGILVYVHKA